ncbi:MAG: hypothetical protein HC859_10300 [Bacteroidia bacterium]|nr:hypothetical protein [Bacteroidia bacterium]
MVIKRLNYSLSLAWVLATSLVMAQAPRIMINPMGHSGKVHNLLFTPDGHKIISISEDKTIRLWSAESGEMLRKFESQIGDGWEGMLYASAISPSGKYLAVAGYPLYLMLVGRSEFAQSWLPFGVLMAGMWLVGEDIRATYSD